MATKLVVQLKDQVVLVEEVLVREVVQQPQEQRILAEVEVVMVLLVHQELVVLVW